MCPSLSLGVGREHVQLLLLLLQLLQERGELRRRHGLRHGAQPRTRRLLLLLLLLKLLQEDGHQLVLRQQLDGRRRIGRPRLLRGQPLRLEQLLLHGVHVLLSLQAHLDRFGGQLPKVGVDLALLPDATLDPELLLSVRARPAPAAREGELAVDGDPQLLLLVLQLGIAPGEVALLGLVVEGLLLDQGLDVLEPQGLPVVELGQVVQRRLDLLPGLVQFPGQAGATKGFRAGGEGGARREALRFCTGFVDSSPIIFTQWPYSHWSQMIGRKGNMMISYSSEHRQFISGFRGFL